MRNWIFLGLIAAFVSAEARAEVNWNASIGLRHLIRKLDDGLDAKNNAFQNQDVSKLTNKRYEYRVVLGAYVKNEMVDFGFDVRTQPTGSLTSEWLSNSNGNDFSAGISQAFAKLHGNLASTDWSVTVGRSKTVMMYDNIVQSLFDNDVRWDGFGWTFKNGMFGFNAAQYVFGAVSQGTTGSSTYSRTEASADNAQTQSHFAMLYAFQPSVQIKLADDILSTFALGFYNWSGTGANTSVAGTTNGSGFFSNAVHGGSAASSNNVNVGNVNPVILDNAQIWQVLSDTSLPSNFRFVVEFLRNKKVLYGTRVNPADPAVEAARNAFAASIAWGKPKKAGDLFFSYSYGNKGIASTVGTFTNGDAPADNISHFLDSKYMVADGFSLGAKAQFHTEKARLGGDGQPLAAPNAGRKQTQQRFEFVTTVQL